MEKKLLLILIITIFIVNVCNCQRKDLWKENYIHFLLESQQISEIPVAEKNFSVYDFDENGIPEIIIHVIGQCEEDKVIIIGYENNKIQTVYAEESSYIDTYYDIDTNELVIYHPNSQGNPVIKYRYTKGQFKTSFHVYASDKYMVTEYKENGEIDTYSMNNEYNDTLEIVADSCKEFKYYELTQENVKNVINSYVHKEE